MEIHSLTADVQAESFMTLTVQAPSGAEETKRNIKWILPVDISDSMNTTGARDTRSRLEHVQHTLIRMFQYLKTHAIKTDSDHEVTVIWFNHSIDIWTVSITKTTDIAPLLEIVSKRQASGSTNIGNVLRKCDELIPSIPEKNTVIVFMSDGEPTEGLRDTASICNIMREMIDRVEKEAPCDLTPVCIGYGTGASPKLLESISSQSTNGEYHCVESEEGAGMVYGEITHGIISEQWRNVIITVEGGEIYDFAKDEWSKELIVGRIASSIKRVFHLRKKGDEELSVRMDYWDSNDGWHKDSDSQNTIIKPSGDDVNRMVEIYSIRQEVLELLTKARKWKEQRMPEAYPGRGLVRNLVRNQLSPPPIQRQRAWPPIDDEDVMTQPVPKLDPLPPLPGFITPQHLIRPTAPPPPPLRQPRSKIGLARATSQVTSGVSTTQVDYTALEYESMKVQLEKKIEYVKDYIKNHGDEKGLLMNLADDLYITLQSLTHRNGLHYIVARQTSQGRQRAYNPVGVNELPEHATLNHCVSDSLTSPYAAPSTAECMRSMSQPVDTTDNDDIGSKRVATTPY